MVRGTLLVEVHFPIERGVPGDPRQQMALGIEVGFVSADSCGWGGLLEEECAREQQSGEKKNAEKAHTAIKRDNSEEIKTGVGYGSASAECHENRETDRQG